MLLWSLTAAVVVLGLAFGGGTMQGQGWDALVQLAGLPLLGFAIMALFSRGIAPEARLPLVLATSTVLLAASQLVPLPQFVWSQLPGRGFVVETFELAGIEPGWMPLSLDPGATWQALLALPAPLAVFVAVLCIGARGRRGLSLILVGFAVASVAFGLAQLMQGPDSGLRFHAVTNTSHSVGFFANRNHHAALLYAAVPFAAAWTIAFAERRIGAAVFGLALAALLLGLAMTLSRAAAVFGLAALLLSGFLLQTGRGARRSAVYALVLAGSIGAMLVVHYALPGLLKQFEAAVIDDYRFDILAITLEAAETFSPVGSGFGTFQAVYLMHDRLDALLTRYVNHAHNDWAELWLEGGWLFVLAAAGFGVWFAQASRAAWRAAPASGSLNQALGRAASISIGLLLLHSLVDYPLRTISLLSVFAVCCALLVPPAGPAETRTTPSSRRPPVRAESGRPVRAGATGPGSRVREP